jgi:hypothetical protein
MPYKIRVLGAEVICDTVAEVKAIIAETATDSTAGGGGDRPQGGTGIGAVLAMLPNTQQSFLRLLVTAGEVSDAQACESLHLENNKVLAGLLAAIHKRFKSGAMPNPVQTEKRFRGGVRSYRYRLADTDARTIKMILTPRQDEGHE